MKRQILMSLVSVFLPAQIVDKQQLQRWQCCQPVFLVDVSFREGPRKLGLFRNCARARALWLKLTAWGCKLLDRCSCNSGPPAGLSVSGSGINFSKVVRCRVMIVKMNEKLCAVRRFFSFSFNSWRFFMKIVCYGKRPPA